MVKRKKVERATVADLERVIRELIHEIRSLGDEVRGHRREIDAIGVERDRWRAQAEGAYGALLLERQGRAADLARVPAKSRGK